MAEPAPTPVTEPVALIDATEELLVVQVPPAVPLVVKVLDAPTHIVVVPDIVPPVGVVCTVISRRARKEPQPYGDVVYVM